jgi:hypothetical protein
MVMLNGTAPHKHTITDFKMTGSPAKNGIATTYNGTATVTLKKGPVSDVPISIKLMGPRAMSLWIDPLRLKVTSDIYTDLRNTAWHAYADDVNEVTHPHFF